MPKHLNWLWTLQNLYFCFVSYLTQRGEDVHKDTRITEKKRFQQDDVMQSKVEKHGVARPSTLMLHCCTSTAQLALSADSWGSKLKAIICKLTHNFIGWTLTTFTATCREKLWKIKRRTAEKEQEMHSDLKDFNSLNLIVPCDHFGLQAGDHVKFMQFFVKIYEMLLWPNGTSSRVSQNWVLNVLWWQTV